MSAAPALSSRPLLPHFPLSTRQQLTRQIKALAQVHGVVVSAVTSAEAFPELEPVLRDRSAAGHLDGLPWFTPERVVETGRWSTFLPEALSILSAGNS